MGKQRNKKAGVRGSDDLEKQNSYVDFLENSWKSKSESKEYTSLRRRATPISSEDGEEKTRNQQGTGSVVLLHKCKVCRKAYLRLSNLEKHEQSHKGKEYRISNKMVSQPPSNTKNKNKSQKKKHCRESTSSNFVENSQDMPEFTTNVSTIQTTSSTANFHDIHDLISTSPTQQEFVDKSQNAPLHLKENVKSLPDSNTLDGLLLVSGFQDKPTLVYPANCLSNSSESSSSSAKKKFTSSNSVKNPLISFQPEEDEVLESLWKPSSALQSEDVVINASSTDEEVHTRVTKILDFLETEEANGKDMNKEESSLNSSPVKLQVPVTIQPVDEKDEHVESVLEDEKNSKKNDKDVRDSDMKYVLVQAEEEKDNAKTTEGGKKEDLKDISEDEDDVMDDPYEGDSGEDEDHISDVEDESYENTVENVNGDSQGKKEDISIELDKIQKTGNSEKKGMDSESCKFSRDSSKKDFQEEDISDEDVNDGDEVEDKNSKSNIGLFSCSVCQEEFKDDANLQTHKRKHIKVQFQSKSKEGALICDICGNSFKSKTGLSLHKKIHSKNKQCVECGKTFDRPILLSRHMLTHSNIKHMCDICGKSYSMISHLRAHISSAHDSTTYDCQECGKVFKHTSNLRKHMRTHFGAKSFICENCGMAFKFSGLLHRHRKIHSNEKNYDCSTCGKSFRSNYALKIHMRTHTKEKPYRCIRCKERFNHKVSLRLHIEKFH
ncbi:uncharacterized protein LOC111101077 [Crassostrea virginica]